MLLLKSLANKKAFTLSPTEWSFSVHHNLYS